MLFRSVRRESKDKPIFSFNLTKRGKLAGMRTVDGKPTLSLKLKHADHKVLWEVAPMVEKFELLKVGQQYAHFSSKPSTARATIIKELEQDYSLDRNQAEAVLKAMVTNGILTPKKVGAALFYEGTHLED